jgi:prolyl oligopeptidase
MPMPPIDYPATRTVDVEDELAGVAMPDPYRWLEEGTEEVRDWQAAQAALASSVVRGWPHYDALRKSVNRCITSRFPSRPRSAAGRWFRTCTPEGATQSIAVVADELTGPGRTLFDPAWENPDKPPFLSWVSPSPDGRILALGLCGDGSENNTIRLVDVESGALLADPPTQSLMDSWLGGVQWLPDSSGFYFTALSGPAFDFEMSVFYYELAGGAPAQSVRLPPAGRKLEYPVALPSPDGRWVIVLESLLVPTPIALLDRAGSGQWRSFATNIEGCLAGYIVGDAYIAVTDVDAPRGRVVAVDLTSPTPNDPASWREIVPESEAVIRSVLPAAGRLYVNEFIDTYARIRIFEADGTPLGEVPLPSKGAIAELPFPLMNVVRPIEQAGFLFNFSSLDRSWGTYFHRPGAVEIETLVTPEVVLEDAVIEDHWAISADGTRIPYHVLRLRNSVPDRPRPALLNGYGGYNAPWLPQYPGAMAAFVAAGGLYVHCHLRGGAEFGRDWWEGGRQKRKQNCYQDLYAIAEDLISRAVSRADLLAVTGASNGGLMAGVAAVQRPDLWRAVVPRYPVLDLIGGCREPYSRHAIVVEFGDPDHAEEVRRMALFSPYQVVEQGRAYPAIYIDAGDTDPRCPAWHSRKFAARLQAAQGGDAPILLHVWNNVGHGWATASDVQVEESAEWLAFVMQQLGMTPGSVA